MNLVIFIVQYILVKIGLYKLFEKAGESGWKAFVPVYGLIVWAKIIGKKPITLLWLLVPIVNIFQIVYMFIDTVNSFGRWGFWKQAAAVFFPYIYLPYLGFKPNTPEEEKRAAAQSVRKTITTANKAPQHPLVQPSEKYCDYYGPSVPVAKADRPAKGPMREWAEAVFFAVFAASFIRMFLIEAYTIPTPSMEGSLKVGDFLFVSKIHYGTRLPMRPLSLPLLHNVVPVLGCESYLNMVDWGYHRAPALTPLKRYDPVVFNYPEGDTIIPGHPFGQQYYDYIRGGYSRKQINEEFSLIVRPTDKKDHYVKRCVGVPGDTIEVRQRELYVNGQKAPVFTYMQYRYWIYCNSALDSAALDNDHNIVIQQISDKRALTDLSLSGLQQLKDLHLSAIDSIVPYYDFRPGKFPHAPTFRWGNDSYGPLWIPKKGVTIHISTDNIDLYRRVITSYEKHTCEVRGGKIIIDGQETNTYTFAMDYYWMMGDNRQNSADSREFGFVPEDHIVGKPLFIWLSLKNGRLFDGIRFNRMFSTADKR